jgi:hypothetical protein
MFRDYSTFILEFSLRDDEKLFSIIYAGKNDPDSKSSMNVISGIYYLSHQPSTLLKKRLSVIIIKWISDNTQ